MTKWVTAKIEKIKYWKKNLLNLVLQASIKKFVAGQFAKLLIKNSQNNTKIQRAYSFVNPPSSKKIEFYITLIKHGKMSQQFKKINENTKILITQKSFGFFTLKEVPSYKNLWMFSTGTAIGPYFSILQEKQDIKRFSQLILIHSVRYFSDLKYLDVIKKLKKHYKKKLIVLITISREKKNGFLYGRIPHLILNDTIEKYTNIHMNNKNSHVMLCGNPNMVKDMFNILQKKKKMTKNLRQKPGNITRENYW
ncbi:FAD-binding oxidoreductase [Buchnera aphidicola]|uniref:FAD-binding oxidoreductase n=1 Tax=Buchnera aphidicola TaxID=9 RepID=UPI00209341E1|nr:FAD-binding oxidoreductase [Buchnera aphidicola]USS94120.1 FAD-binding oxidoreductase [Buchnera aphidicola (Sipha maydis)]